MWGAHLGNVYVVCPIGNVYLGWGGANQVTSSWAAHLVMSIVGGRQLGNVYLGRGELGSVYVGSPMR